MIQNMNKRELIIKTVCNLIGFFMFVRIPFEETIGLIILDFTGGISWYLLGKFLLIWLRRR